MVAEGDQHIAAVAGCIAVAMGRCIAVAMVGMHSCGDGVGMMVAKGDRLAS